MRKKPRMKVVIKYPAWRVNRKTGESQIVASEEADKALGADWCPRSELVEKPSNAAPVEPRDADSSLEDLSVETLHALAESEGLKLHHRTGKERAIEEIRAHRSAKRGVE